MLLFSFLGGVVADHTHKLRLLFITQAALMLLALILGLLVEFNLIKVWDLCIIVFLSGTVMAFDIPVRQAFIVELVGKLLQYPQRHRAQLHPVQCHPGDGPRGGRHYHRLGGHGQLLFSQHGLLFGGAGGPGPHQGAARHAPTPWTPFRRAWKELFDHISGAAGNLNSSSFS